MKWAVACFVFLLPVAAFAGDVTLVTADDSKVFGTYNTVESKKVVLLFHQAGSNRHEYDKLTPQLNEWGFDTLAIDQRSGGAMWGHDNATVKARGKSTKYIDALPDLQAAVEWATAKEYAQVIVVGSSYSASLVFLLARDNPETVTALASFSPGEYLGGDNIVKDAAAKVTVPVYVTAASTSKEEQRVDAVLSRAKNAKVTRQRAKVGVHGASTLRSDRNAKGVEQELASFREFMIGLEGR